MFMADVRVAKTSHCIFYWQLGIKLTILQSVIYGEISSPLTFDLFHLNSQYQKITGWVILGVFIGGFHLQYLKGSSNCLDQHL